MRKCGREGVKEGGRREGEREGCTGSEGGRRRGRGGGGGNKGEAFNGCNLAHTPYQHPRSPEASAPALRHPSCPSQTPAGTW